MVPRIAASTPVTLQVRPGELPEIDLFVSVTGSAVGVFLTTLLVGAIMVALAPGYTERMMDAVRTDVLGSFAYGFLALVVLVILTLVLVFSIVGILVAIPLVIVASVVWAVGAAIAYLAVAERLVGTEDGWLRALLVAAFINGGLTLTGIGGLVSICVGAAGFGAVLRDRFG